MLEPDYPKRLPSISRMMLHESTFSTWQTITNSRISKRRSRRSYLDTKDWGLPIWQANSHCVRPASLRAETSLWSNPSYSSVKTDFKVPRPIGHRFSNSITRFGIFQTGYTSLRMLTFLRRPLIHDRAGLRASTALLSPWVGWAFHNDGRSVGPPQLLPLRLSHPIAPIGLGENVLGVVRLISQLAPQTNQVSRIHPRTAGPGLASLHSQQMLVGKNTPSVDLRLGQQVVLGALERNRLNCELKLAAHNRHQKLRYSWAVELQPTRSQTTSSAPGAAVPGEDRDDLSCSPTAILYPTRGSAKM